jgi:hypothetical protein
MFLQKFDVESFCKRNRQEVQMQFSLVFFGFIAFSLFLGSIFFTCCKKCMPKKLQTDKNNNADYFLGHVGCFPGKPVVPHPSLARIPAVPGITQDVKS